MLLTITYEGENTQEISYLLYKNPSKKQEFEISAGRVCVFYPELSDGKTTVALLLDLNPIDLARGKSESDRGLFDYVNDRPYTACSFLSTAIVRVLGTAMSGRCPQRQELANSRLNLTAKVYSLPCTQENLPNEIFEPLGYSVKFERGLLDENFPEWGESPYINLEISGKVRLSELLSHLYVLIPVFDRQKHYYISEAEIDKLLSHGGQWLANHPYRDKIVYRYFAMKKSYARTAIDRLLENSREETPEKQISQEEDTEKRVPLNEQRLETVKNLVVKSGAKSVIDMGCGYGKLTKKLLTETKIENITAFDVSAHVLEKAKTMLHYETMSEYRKSRLNLMQASLTYTDKKFKGFDCACIVEVMEHLEKSAIPAFERVVFEYAVPKTVIITTPNRDYNVNYEFLREDSLRHPDHRFEFSREDFGNWTEEICRKFGYTVEITGVGENIDGLGQPTQIGVFRKCV